MLEQSLGFIALISAMMSVALGIAFVRTARRLTFLQAVETLDSAPARISVIVPARNEQADIGQCMASMLAQQGVDLEIIVVNDHSTDRTRPIVDAIAADDDRVTVIHDPPLPDGWLGKANAMQHGLERATADYIVLSDADVHHDTRCFASAIAQMRSHQIDLLSLCPRWIFVSFWENVLLPHCFVAGIVQFFPASVNDPSSERAAAAGAFILTRRHVLDRIGGLRLIRSEMLDDVKLACAVKRHGFNTRFHLAPQLLEVRLFKGNRDAFCGLTKNILGSVERLWLAIPAMFLPVFVYWLPLAALAVGIHRSAVPLIVLGATAYSIQLYLVYLSTRICSVRWSKAICFPAAAIPVMFCFGTAIYHRLVSGAVAWRGRLVRI